MPFGVDIHEDEIQSWGNGILDTLLCDRTTGDNIIWATYDYKNRGCGYDFFDSIAIEKICGEGKQVIQPRITKSPEEQKRRITEKAEVFTPSWICNAQNNLIDKAWFETDDDIFNHETEKDGIKTWEPLDKNQLPPFPKGKSWRMYISENRLEMACGEAPYLCSRYDTTTGEMIPVLNRIGLLDRKFHLINANTPDIKPEMEESKRIKIRQKWIRYAYKALQSIYGFEWQGDNLLLARESMLITFIEFYQEKWKTNKLPHMKCLKKAAEIISWNIWQMDGLTLGIPGYAPTHGFDSNIFDDNTSRRQRLCRIMEWTDINPLKGNELIFAHILNNKTKKD